MKELLLKNQCSICHKLRLRAGGCTYSCAMQTLYAVYMASVITSLTIPEILLGIREGDKR